MDIIQDRKMKKRLLEHGLEKPSQDRQIQKSKSDVNTITLKGERIELPPDIKDLIEFNWDDPKNQRWIKEQDDRIVKQYGRLSTEEMENIYKEKLHLIGKNPSVSESKAFDLSWEKVTGKKLQTRED